MFFLIDSRLVLYHLNIDRDSEIMASHKLQSYPELENAVETYVRGTDFIRVSISDRCIGINGMNYNFKTNYSWDFLCANRVSQDKKLIRSIQRQENLPFSNLQIALF